MTLHLGLGIPSDPELCPRCQHATAVTFPVVGFDRSGVLALGIITGCADCDSSRNLFHEFLTARGWFNKSTHQAGRAEGDSE